MGHSISKTKGMGWANLLSSHKTIMAFSLAAPPLLRPPPFNLFFFKMIKMSLEILDKHTPLIPFQGLWKLSFRKIPSFY